MLTPRFTRSKFFTHSMLLSLRSLRVSLVQVFHQFDTNSTHVLCYHSFRFFTNSTHVLGSLSFNAPLTSFAPLPTFVSSPVVSAIIPASRHFAVIIPSPSCYLASGARVYPFRYTPSVAASSAARSASASAAARVYPFRHTPSHA